MSKIDGYENEYEFVKYLNRKKVGELNPMFRSLIDDLFGEKVSDNMVITSWCNKYPQKADIFIKLNGDLKGISIKKGMKNSVHVEGISRFIHFLISSGVERDIIIKYLRYQYADGTTNGTGRVRQTVTEYKKNHESDINDINKAMNQEEILKKAIERFVTRGNNSKYPIDAIISGEVNDFIWIKTGEIEKIILNKRNIDSTAVHFGPLTCQPKNRCLNYNRKYEKDRYCVQLKWYNLWDDIIEFMNEKEYKKKLKKEK